MFEIKSLVVGSALSIKDRLDNCRRSVVAETNNSILKTKDPSGKFPKNYLMTSHEVLDTSRRLDNDRTLNCIYYTSDVLYKLI